jgi:hypothetical protein
MQTSGERLGFCTLLSGASVKSGGTIGAPVYYCCGVALLFSAESIASEAAYSKPVHRELNPFKLGIACGQDWISADYGRTPCWAFEPGRSGPPRK